MPHFPISRGVRSPARLPFDHMDLPLRAKVLMLIRTFGMQSGTWQRPGAGGEVVDIRIFLHGLERIGADYIGSMAICRVPPAPEATRSSASAAGEPGASTVIR